MSLQWLDETASSRSPSAADSQSQGRDVSVRVPQHPLVDDGLLGDRDRWPFGRSCVLKTE